ncbi:helix-turn-helix domain-containing protein [Mycobacteroides abscessus]|uniref:helix-turn-helix domain-containing protein n=1 Tax=Mycobacteroides abscessus TaxID=36809 RepID=UPI0013000D88|nr:helix-turn-helix domain-containing protein [Mycobacteroides abscessus]
MTDPARRHLRGLPSIYDPTDDTPPARSLYTVAETAERLNCSVSRVRAMLRDGRLRRHAIGRRVFIPADDVDRLADGG